MVKTLLGSTFVEWYSDFIWFNRIPCLIETTITIGIIITHCAQLCFYFRAVKMESELVDIDNNINNVPTPRSTTRRSTVSRSRSRSASNASSSSSQNDPLILGALTILVIIFTFLYQAHQLIGLFPFLHLWIGPVKYCSVWPNLLAAFWHSVKCSIYNLYLYRIKAVFRNSCYMYSNRTIYTLFAMINIFWLFSIFGDFTEIYGVWVHVESENSYWCRTNAAVFGMIISGITDTFISTLCLILFIKPLIKLFRNDDDSLQQLVVRYFLLSSIAILSTFAMTFLAVFVDCGGISSVSINLICVLLMSTMYSKVYVCLCKPCHKVVESMIMKKKETKVHNANITV